MKWSLTAIILLTLRVQAFSLTLSDLLTQTRIFLRDTASDSSRQRFSDSQLTTFLNNGQKETNSLVFAVINSSSFLLISGTTEYSLTSNFIMPLRVTINNAPIVERTFSFLDDSDSGWISSTGTPNSYYIRVDSSLVSGVTRESIGFTPISTYTISCTLQYLAQPSDLSLSGDVPFGSTNNRLYPFHHGLAFYAAYRGYMAMGDLEMANYYIREYQNIVQMMENTIKNRAMFNPTFRGQIQAQQQSGGK